MNRNTRESSPPVRTQTRINADLFEAIRRGDEPGVRKALAQGADIGAVLRSRTPLERALCNHREWNAGVIARLLEAVNLQAEPDVTRAWDACARCDWPLLEHLVQAGEASALRALLSITPDRYRCDSIDIVRSTLVNGVSASATHAIAPLVFRTPADVHERNVDQATWLHRAVISVPSFFPSDTSVWNWLNGNGMAPDNPALVAHLLSLKPQVDIQWFGLTALHLAALNDCRDSLELLLDAGADCEKEDGNGKHILNFYFRSTECRELLVHKRLQRELQAHLPMPATDVRARPRARM